MKNKLKVKILAGGLSAVMVFSAVKPAAFAEETWLHWIAKGKTCFVKRNIIDRKIAEHPEWINETDNNGETPLHYAARSGNYQFLEYLDDYIANVNCQNNKGRTPLYLAVENDHIGIVKYLVERKDADINCGDDELLSVAVDKGYFDIVELLAYHGAGHMSMREKNNMLLCLAARCGYLGDVKWLVEHGADVNCRDNSGWTPLHWAASRGRIEVVKYLVKYGADVNCKNKHNDTPLSNAAREGHMDVVKYFVEISSIPLSSGDSSSKSLSSITDIAALKKSLGDLIAQHKTTLAANDGGFGLLVAKDDSEDGKVALKAKQDITTALNERINEISNIPSISSADMTAKNAAHAAAIGVINESDPAKKIPDATIVDADFAQVEGDVASIKFVLERLEAANLSASAVAVETCLQGVLDNIEVDAEGKVTVKDGEKLKVVLKNALLSAKVEQGMSRLDIQKALGNKDILTVYEKVGVTDDFLKLTQIDALKKVKPLTKYNGSRQMNDNTIVKVYVEMIKGYYMWGQIATKCGDGSLIAKWKV